MKRTLTVTAVIVLTLALLAGASAVWAYHQVVSPVSHTARPVSVVITPGEPVRLIADQLLRAKLISNSLVFELYVYAKHLENRLEAGSYVLSPTMTMGQIIVALETGRAPSSWITIPPGFTDAQIALRVAALHIDTVAAFDAQDRAGLWQHIAKFAPFLSQLPPQSSLEGYLYPNTYLVPSSHGAATLIRLALAQFASQFNSALRAQAAQGGHSISEVVILASLVEREAKFPSDAPKVCSVFYNRLAISMPLQVDATVLFALGRTGGPLTYADLQVNSPYNTYLHVGLPPGPISNPALVSLRACVDPAHTNFLYYVSDNAGHIYYASTLSQHEQQVGALGL